MTNIDKFHEWVESQSPLALREYIHAQAAWQARGELDKALAETQEPVGWKDKIYGNLHHADYGDSIPLYTTPPSREWVGLSDAEIVNEIVSYPWGKTEDWVRAIEAKLKERNI